LGIGIPLGVIIIGAWIIWCCNRRKGKESNDDKESRKDEEYENEVAGADFHEIDKHFGKEEKYDNNPT
jgi:hypothetical protein